MRFLEFGSKLKSYIWEFLDGELQRIGGICEEYIPAVFIHRHIGELAFLEIDIYASA